MSTTLSIEIDDDVSEAARCMAPERDIPLGEALSSMAGGSMRTLGLRRSESGILVFDTPPDFPAVTDEDVAAAMADFP